MRISGNYGTHLAALIKVMSLTKGDVLELGVGMFSTPVLHYLCLLSKRHLVSYDNDKGWVKRFAISTFSNFQYEGLYHEFKYVNDWDEAKIEKPWDVVLVDHSPDFRRAVEIKRLAKLAKYIVIHDSNESREKIYRNYHYSDIYPLFKYKKVWDFDKRHATVLSNFISLEKLW